MKKISIDNLYVRYAERLPVVLENISFSLDSGDTFYLAGANRKGKTTLLRSIGGVIPWVMGEISGKINVLGTNVSKSSLEKICESIKYISSDPFASILGLTVGQEVMLISDSESYAREMLTLLGIDHLWDRETLSLSGGEMVRLVLTGALLSRSKVLLFDSPLQELDPSGRKAFIEALNIIRAQHGGTVIVTDPFWQELKPYIDSALYVESKNKITQVPTKDFFENGYLELSNLRRSFLGFQSASKGSRVALMDDVYVSLGGNEILRGFSMELREGELVVIAGENGSGKTTAMLTLAGAIKHSKGTFESKGSMSYVFQHPHLQTVRLTVKEELEMGPKLNNWSGEKTEKYVEESLSWLGLEPNDCPLDLHPADKRLLMIAVSGASSSVVIMDEPTIDLDTVDICKVLDFISERRKKGVAFVVITHDQDIMNLADRVLVVDKGRVVREYVPEREVR